MQNVNEIVVDYLKENGFSKIRDLGEEIKINFDSLTKYELEILINIPASLNIIIKRSGTGLLVILKN